MATKSNIKLNSIWMTRHTSHLVFPSPWPLLAALSSFGLTTALIRYMHNGDFSYYVPYYGNVELGGILLGVSLLFVIMIMFFWFKDIIFEGTYGGYHTFIVQQGLRFGVILFIVSEIMFFFGFFWAYLHSSLVPAVEIGSEWPAEFNQLTIFNPTSIPFLNTIILLSSGYTITRSHHYLLVRDVRSTIKNLINTILLGIFFLAFQVIEYFEATFTISDGIFGTTFYMITGFHGLHVCIGVIMLFYSLIRFIDFLKFIKIKKNKKNFSYKLLPPFTQTSNIGYESSIWYWHFVDVVWIFVYLILYIWPYLSLLG